MRKNVIITCLIILLFLIITISASAASGEIRVFVDGKEVDLPDQKPFINCDSRTLVPVRFVSEALGAQVEWQECQCSVRISHKEKSIIQEIGSKQAVVDSNIVNLDTAAMIYNSRTMVPLRFVSECLGARVDWDGKERAVYIYTDLPPAKPFVGIPFKPSDLPTDDGSIIYGSDRPGARIMWAKISDLPIQYGKRIIYSIDVNESYVSVKQYSDTKIPCGIFFVENNKLTRRRAYSSDIQKTTIFTYQNPVNISTDTPPPVDIRKVSHFVIEAFDNVGFLMLVVENPVYSGR